MAKCSLKGQILRACEAARRKDFTIVTKDTHSASGRRCCPLGAFSAGKPLRTDRLDYAVRKLGRGRAWLDGFITAIDSSEFTSVPPQHRAKQRAGYRVGLAVKRELGL